MVEILGAKIPLKQKTFPKIKESSSLNILNIVTNPFRDTYPNSKEEGKAGKQKKPAHNGVHTMRAGSLTPKKEKNEKLINS